MPLPYPSAQTPQGQQSLIHYLLRPQFLPFMLMLVVVSAVIWGIDFSARQSNTLNKAQQRLSIINQVARNVLDAETGLRGFLLTGQPSFLEPYQTAQQSLSHNLDMLEKEPATQLQYQNIKQVRYLTQKWHDQIAAPLLAQQVAGKMNNRQLNTSQLQLLRGLEGKNLIDQTRSVIATLERNESMRRQQAMLASYQALALARLLTIVGLLLAVILIWWSAVRSAQALAKMLNDLNRDVSHITQGQYDFQLSRLPIIEVQRLGDQFEQMASAVREREYRLQRTNADLERSNRELEQFAYIASHDLQEPLRTIGSYTELLAKRYSGQLDERADKYINFTLSATHRLKRLIQDLLAFSRVRQPGREMNMVNLTELVNTVISDLSVTIKAQQAQIEVGPLPTVRGNPELLRHVFQNLLSNAIKFRAPERTPVVRVEAINHPTAWQFLVSDNGVGIAPEYFERIFGVFQRLESKSEGSGIGLAVVRTAIERHGGEISLRSTVGEGSTFCFTLPHRPTDEATHDPTAVVTTPSASSSIHSIQPTTTSVNTP